MTKNIEIYSLPTWPYCIKTKDYFNSLGVHYVDHNVADEVGAKQEMIDKTGQMKVPATLIDGELVLGFDKEKFDELLR